MSSRPSSRALASGSSSRPQDQDQGQEGRGTQIPLQPFLTSTSVEQSYRSAVPASVEELSLQADHGSSAGLTEAAAHTATLTGEMDGPHCINIEADDSASGIRLRPPTMAAHIIERFLAEAELKGEDHGRITIHLSKFKIHPLMEREFQQSILSESLYQQNCLLSRAKLFQEFLRACRQYEQSSLRPNLETLGARVAFCMNGDKDVQKAIERHTNAMEAYRGFRKDADKRVSDKHAMRLAGMLISLEEKKLEVDRLSQASNTSERQKGIQQIEADIFDLEIKISKFLLQTRNSLVSRFTPFLLRVVTAYFAAGMILAPMSVLFFVEELSTALIVAYVFIVLVPAAVAMFMVDATPKDIMAVTAAYAAVIVVFVGAN